VHLDARAGRRESPARPPRSRLRDAWALLRQAFWDWLDDGAPRLGASLAYYTLFSLAPLLLLAIAIAGLAFGEEAAQGRIVAELEVLVGRAGAEAVEQLVQNSRRPEAGVAASIVALGTLLLGASGVFVELRSSLDTIWDVKPPAGGITAMLRARLAAFALVVAVGFLSLVSLLVSTALSAMGRTIGDGLGEGAAALLQALNTLGSLAVLTLLFAMLFKLVPDTDVAWRDVWFGAVTTSVLFAIGKYAIGLYLAHSGLGSTFGAAASVVILMVWVYYAAQIFFFGAELTHAHARRRSPKPAADQAVFTRTRG
jgi:membrane protein